MQEEQPTGGDIPESNLSDKEEVISDNEPVITPNNFLCKFTIDGEVLVEKQSDGNFKTHPLKTVKMLPVPIKIKDSHVNEMSRLHALIVAIKKDNPKRVVPVTFNEYLGSGGNVRLCNELCKAGLMKKATVALIASNGKNPGSRLCLYYTPQGRAFVRSRIDPSYALTEYE